MKGFIKGGKFHPTDTKAKPYRYAKKGSGKGIIPSLGLKFTSERKESFSEINADISRDASLRQGLIDKNDVLADKIEANDKSEFNPSRKEEIRLNVNIIKNINNDIKKLINSLTNEERKKLPENVKDLRRFL